MGLFNHNDGLNNNSSGLNNNNMQGVGTQAGYNPTGDQQHNGRHDMEGAAMGGVAGHEFQKHHNGTGGPGMATGAAAGALGGHEYNEHHHGGHHGRNNNEGPAGINAANGPGGQALSAHNIQSNKEARHLNRTGKIEHAIGEVLCSTTLKQKGLQKEAAGRSMQQQGVDVAAAENLEAEAQMHRTHAQGLGSHPNNVMGGGATTGLGTTGMQSGQNNVGTTGF